MTTKHSDVKYTAGQNIAIKVPDHEYQTTVNFYRDVLGFPVDANTTTGADSVALQFGTNTLWIDKVPTLSQAEIWLEIHTDNIDAARANLTAQGYKMRDSIEPLPEKLHAFWLAGPSNIIHLINQH